MTSPLMLLAALALAGLLFWYVEVLEGAVRQGELRRIAVVDRARSAWRCSTLLLDADRTQCRLKLNAPLREVL